MLKQYYTVNPTGSTEIIIQKSRFIGYVKRTETEAEAHAFIQMIKKKHHDATHNCSAYLIGEHDEIQKANDDGEPSGTAGVPMLEVLKKQKLKDTSVVVTRYFGGIKLGAGGLIRAYGNATSEAIKATGIVSRQLMQGYSVTIDYHYLGSVENELRNSAHIIESINYLEKVELIIFALVDDVDKLIDLLVNLTSDNLTYKPTVKKYVEVQI